MINIVTIDPSLISTAITVNGHIISVASENIAHNKKQELTTWFETISDYCDIIPINTEYKKEKKYSQLEMNKLETFQKTSNLIRKTVDNHCDDRYNTICVIEGYSYSSATGPLIDLVTFGTMLRRLFFTRKDTELIVLAPTTVKRLSAKMTYPPIKKGKKIEYRNHDGVAGGSFKKHEMYRALTDNTNIKTPWVDFLRKENEMLEMKSIPKPIDDINDSVLMYHIVDFEYHNCNKNYHQTIKNIKEN